MKQEIRYNLSDLSFSFPRHTIKISKYEIPILVDISDIKIEHDNEMEIGLLGKDDIFSNEYHKIKEINAIVNGFKYINTKDRLYDNFSKNFTEYHNLNNIEELLNVFDEQDVECYINHISKIIVFMVNEYRRRLYNALKLDIEPPSIAYKSDIEKKMSVNVKEYLAYTESFISIKSLKEFNSTVFFKENVGLSVEEWSFRELELHLAYVSIKNRTESVESKESARIMHVDSNKK